MKKMIILIILAIIAVGCLEEINDLGCCNKDEATDSNNPRCVIIDAIEEAPTGVEYDVTDVCDATSGCNAIVAPGETMIIPVCTKDYKVSCLNPDCTAMVCGEFSFTPRLAPGYANADSESDEPPEDAVGDAPASEDSAAQNFYKARCRFLPMDINFKKIMKSSKSVINVFRLGAGGSFDEYDQYRYYLPMSDKFCALNLPSIASEGKVDRYMNYLQPGPASYNEEITTNCLTDATAPPPFRYNGLDVNLNDYGTVVPDITGYKFARQLRRSQDAVWDENNCGGVYVYTGTTRNAIFKRIDTGYYKRYLSSAYAELIYDVDNIGLGRASFECRIDKSECYSGKCDTSVYNRGVLVKGTSADPNADIEVATDCFKALDENKREMVFCYPTKDVIVNSETDPPTFNYASVPIKLQYLELVHTYGDDGAEIFNDRDFDNIDDEGDVVDGDGDTIEEYWANVANEVIFMDPPANSKYPVYLTKAIKTMSFDIRQKKFCGNPASYYANENWSVYCTQMTQEIYGPPIGGAVFFGKPKTEGEITYHGNRIIGYALATPTEFQDIYAIDRCGLNHDPMFPNREALIEGTMSNATCIYQCTNSCTGPGIQAGCNSWCNKNIDSPPEPCTLSTNPDKIYETEDYIRVHLTGMNTPEWKELMEGFETYYKDRMVAMRDVAVEDCDHEFIPADAVFSAMPWVVSFAVVGKTDHVHTPGDTFFNELASQGETPTKLSQIRNTYHNINYQKTLLSGSAAQAFRKRNIFDLPMGTTRGTTACNLEWLEYEWLNDDWAYYRDRAFYYLAYSTDIYLFKGKAGEDSFGQCKIDDNTKLPVIKELGWCEPCTTSTIAYQKVTLRDKPYLPLMNYKIDINGIDELPASLNDIMDTIVICSAEYDRSFGYGGYGSLGCGSAMDTITCNNDEIPDVSDLSGISFGLSGTPRSIPDATILKERIGNYMRSGILPVIDLSDESNWNLTNPNYHHVDGLDDFFGTDSSPPTDYAFYDFEKLIGNMGVVVVIIDTIDLHNTELTQDQANQIAGRLIERAEQVKGKCDGCLVAVRFSPEPFYRQKLSDAVISILSSDPSLNNMVDIIAYSYFIGGHPVEGDGDYADRVVNNIQAFSADILEAPGINKLTMIVGLTAADNDQGWTNGGYASILDRIVLRQSDLIRSGLIGIVYFPIRDYAGGDGFITVTDPPESLGTKDNRFCILQNSFQIMSTTPPSAVFNRVDAENQINCTLCSSVDIAQGSCGPEPGDTFPLCDDGSFCTMPNANLALPLNDPYRIPEPINFKCLSGSVKDTTCEVCSELSGHYVCTRKFQNNSQDTITGLMSELDSDLYLDVIGGIEKPNKCCLAVDVVGLNGPETYKYTYTKESSISPVNKPIVYSKAGYTEVDCGFGSTSGFGDTTSFCGQSVIPIRNYDINCTLTP
ncbi:MAG: hypothetical protein ABID61_00280 [Candidatus Micrarchaeota archaeon]